MLSISRSHKRTIRFGQTPPAPPPGYHLRRVKRWGQDAVMVRAGFSTTMQMVGDPPHEVGQFAFVTPYGVRADGSWVGSWSAVANFSRLTYDDLRKIAAWQTPDEYDTNQKMNYLYHQLAGTEKVAEMWGEGAWDETTQAFYGHMVHAGQWVALSDTLETVQAQMPNESSKRLVQMRELLLIRRADLEKSHATCPWLIQRATVANPGDRYGDAPRGIVYMCVMLHPGDFPPNNKAVRALLPVEWLE